MVDDISVAISSSVYGGASQKHGKRRKILVCEITMKYYKCKECWRVYDNWQLIEGPMESCVCGSRRFKNSANLLLRRLLTDFKYTMATWIRERLNHEKRS